MLYHKSKMEFLLKTTDYKFFKQYLVIYILTIAAEHLIIKILYQVPRKQSINPFSIANTQIRQSLYNKPVYKK